MVNVCLLFNCWMDGQGLGSGIVGTGGVSSPVRYGKIVVNVCGE